jgi:hypothetical protein
MNGACVVGALAVGAFVGAIVGITHHCGAIVGVAILAREVRRYNFI